MNEFKQLLKKKKAEMDREKNKKKGRKKKDTQPKSGFSVKSVTPHPANLNSKNADEVKLPQEPSSASIHIINEYATEASKSLDTEDKTPKVDLDSIEGNKNYNAMLTKYVGDLDITKLPKHHLASLIPKLEDEQELRKLQFQTGGTANRVYISKDMKIIYDGGLLDKDSNPDYKPEIMIFYGSDNDIFWFIMEKLVIRPYFKKADRAYMANVLREEAKIISKTGKASDGYEWLVTVINQKKPGERDREFFARLFRVSGKMLDMVRNIKNHNPKLFVKILNNKKDEDGKTITLSKAMNMLKNDINYITEVELEKEFNDFQKNGLSLSDKDKSNIQKCINEDLNPKEFTQALLKNRILEHTGKPDEELKAKLSQKLDIDRNVERQKYRKEFDNSISDDTKIRIAEHAKNKKQTSEAFLNTLIKGLNSPIFLLLKKEDNYEINRHY